MMRPRWRKVLSDLIGNLGRSILVVLSIAVGLFAIGILITNHRVIAADMVTGYRAVNPANIMLVTTPFGDDLVERVKGVKGVTDALGVHRVSLRVQTTRGDWIPMDFNAIPDMDTQPINRVHRLAGIWPPDDKEVVVEQSKLSELGVGLGDEITLELPSGKLRRMRIVGIVKDLTLGAAAGGGGFFLAAPQGYITPATLPWLEQSETWNTLYVTVEGGENEATIRQVAQKVRREVEGEGVVILSSAVRTSENHPNRIYVDAVVGVLFVLGALVVFLSGFLITNTLNALLAQQMVQIGVMKLIGARRWQVAGIYQVLILVYGVLALLLALPLSARFSYVLLDYLADRINLELQGFRVVPLAIIVQVLLALAVPQAAALGPILHGVRVRIHEVISGIRPSEAVQSPHWIERLQKRFRRLPRPLLISLRNTFRRTQRLILTLITLTLGGAIFIATFNTQAAIERYIQQLSRYFLADVNLTFETPQRIQRVQNDLAQVPGVGHVEGWAYTRADLLGTGDEVLDTVQLIGVPIETTLVTPILREGRWLQTGDRNVLVVNERFRATLPHLRVGDTLRLRINGSEREWVVIGFLQLAGQNLGHMAYVPYPELSRQLGQSGRGLLFRVAADRPNLSLAEQEDLARRVDAFLKARGYHVTEARAGLSVLEKTAKGLDVLTNFLLILSGLAAAVGSIGLAGTMSLNVMERTREIGIMRAIGASDGTIRLLVIVEGMLIGLMSWVLASLAAFPISRLLSNVISHAIFNAPALFAYTPTGFLAWLGAALVLSVFASLVPARTAVRLTIREVLAYE
jgi:putative ABC transport system permease protein